MISKLKKSYSALRNIFMLSDRERCVFSLQTLKFLPYARNLAGWWEQDAERRW